MTTGACRRRSRRALDDRVHRSGSGWLRDDQRRRCSAGTCAAGRSRAGTHRSPSAYHRRGPHDVRRHRPDRSGGRDRRTPDRGMGVVAWHLHGQWLQALPDHRCNARRRTPARLPRRRRLTVENAAGPTKCPAAVRAGRRARPEWATSPGDRSAAKAVIVRETVASEATRPYRPGSLRSSAISARQSSPRAKVTARSTTTLAGSWTANGLRQPDSATDITGPKPAAVIVSVNRTPPAWPTAPEFVVSTWRRG